MYFIINLINKSLNDFPLIITKKSIEIKTEKKKVKDVAPFISQVITQHLQKKKGMALINPRPTNRGSL